MGRNIYRYINAVSLISPRFFSYFLASPTVCWYYDNLNGSNVIHWIGTKSRPPSQTPPIRAYLFFSGLQVDASLLLEPDLYCWAGNGGGRPETAVLPEWFFVASLSSLPFITQVPHMHITHKHVIHTRCLQDQKRNKYLSLLKRQPRKKKKKISSSHRWVSSKEKEKR